MAIRHLTAAAVAATLSLSLIACGGSAEPEAASSSTPTEWTNSAYDENGNPVNGPVQDWDADFDARWPQIDKETRDTVCELTSGTQSQFIADWGVDADWPEERIAAWYDNARTTDYCQTWAEAEARKDKQRRERQWAEAKAQRDREYKIDAMPSDSSLTADQKVALYDAVCEYLATPGSDLLAPTSVLYPPLGPDATGQQKWDAAVASGYLMASGDCR